MPPSAPKIPPAVTSLPGGTGPLNLGMQKPVPPPLDKPGTVAAHGPALESNPISAAYRPVSRLTSLGLSSLVWGLLGGACFLAFRMEAGQKAPLPLPTQGVALQLTDSDAPALDGGGHQGGGSPPPRAAEPEPAQPLPPRDLPTDLPAPIALPTTALLASPTPQALGVGVAGGTGMGSGYGTGSGSGTGTGGGTGSGNGSGDGTQDPKAPVVIPYSQVSILKAVTPEYPEKARRRGLQGQVVVRVTIDENGVPFAFHVMGGEEHFVKEALKVLPHWRFTPVTQLGKRVKATFDAVINYTLS